MEFKLTQRGFSLIEFNDIYGSECSIQKSSLATEDAVWIGINNANPKIMASQTSKGGTGWVPYDIPENVLLTTRMHINCEQAKEVSIILRHFAEYGELSAPENQESKKAPTNPICGCGDHIDLTGDRDYKYENGIYYCTECMGG